MKKSATTKNEATRDMTNNTINLCGTVTFAKEYADGKIVNLGIGCQFTDAGKEFTAYPTVKVFSNVIKTGFENITDIEKGDEIEVVAHFSTRSYEDKNKEKRFTTEVIADSIIVAQ